MGLTAKEKSEIALNEATARLRNLEAETEAAELTHTRLHNQLAVRDLHHNETQDFYNGHFRWDDPIDEGSVAAWCHNLRRYSRQFKGLPIVIEFCCGGGSIIDGFALFDELLRLRKDGHHITIRVRGNAASMAAVVLQAADKRECGANSFLMLHRASFGAMGSAYEIEDSLEFVKKLEARIIAIFAERSGKPVDNIQRFFDARKDIWFDAQEALAAGLIDEVN